MPPVENVVNRGRFTQVGLVPRIGIIAAALIVETLLMSYLMQATPAESATRLATVIHGIQHWSFRFVIAYAVSFGMLVYLRGARTLASISATATNTPVRLRWGMVHLLLLLPFAVFSAALYGDFLALPFPALAIAWHACGICAVGALFAAMAPLPVWMKALRQTTSIPVYASLPAIAAVLAIKGSQLLWAPAAELTFGLVQILLRPLVPSLLGDPSTLTVATDHFAVTISEVCSGLEGVGLMLAFCASWLWYFRREYHFPRALTIVPAALLLVFLLNAVRISALVLIGNAGYERIAMVGFHSQAGWIAFNLAAFGVAIVARHSPWLNRGARRPTASASATAKNATAAYLMPLLTILAAGMVAHALSAGFDLLYPLRLVAAAVVLWAYKRSYRAALDWTFGWRALAVGGLVFCVWAVFARFLTTATATPADLSRLPTPVQGVWIGCRAAAAMVTVPIAEELAYRGYLMRRLVSPNFDSVAFSAVRWPALGLSALAFGITHGSLWLPGIMAGLAYGALAMKTGSIGECVAAHATTNALLAIYVLRFDQWQLW
jgi:exosortase E/protease (VPEID-CTERM system)